MANRPNKSIKIKTHLDDEEVVFIPAGYEQVKGDEPCKPGDMFYNLAYHRFSLAELSDHGIPAREFAALVRKTK